MLLLRRSNPHILLSPESEPGLPPGDRSSFFATEIEDLMMEAYINEDTEFSEEILKHFQERADLSLSIAMRFLAVPGMSKYASNCALELIGNHGAKADPAIMRSLCHELEELHSRNFSSYVSILSVLLKIPSAANDFLLPVGLASLQKSSAIFESIARTETPIRLNLSDKIIGQIIERMLLTSPRERETLAIILCYSGVDTRGELLKLESSKPHLRPAILQAFAHYLEAVKPHYDRRIVQRLLFRLEQDKKNGGDVAGVLSILSLESMETLREQSKIVDQTVQAALRSPKDYVEPCAALASWSRDGDDLLSQNQLDELIRLLPLNKEKNIGQVVLLQLLSFYSLDSESELPVTLKPWHLDIIESLIQHKDPQVAEGAVATLIDLGQEGMNRVRKIIRKN